MHLRKYIKKAAEQPFEENFLKGLKLIKQSFQECFPIFMKPKLCVLILTGRCNLRCRMCNYPLKKYNELTTVQWKNIINDLKNNGFSKATFQGGEVLLRKDWYEIASYAYKQGFSNTLTTNGTIIDRYLDKLSVFDSIVFSIDSLKLHDEIRGVKGVFDKVLANMRLVRKLGYRIQIHTVLLPENCEEIPDLVRFAKEEGAMLNLIYPMTEAFDDTVPRNKNLREFDTEKLRYLLTNALRYEHVMNCKEFYELCILTNSQDVKRRCLEPRRKIVIQPDGRVFPCCGPLPCVGNIAERKYSTIYSSKIYRLIRKKTYEGKMKLCNRCVSDGVQHTLFGYTRVRIL